MGLISRTYDKFKKFAEMNDETLAKAIKAGDFVFDGKLLKATDTLIHILYIPAILLSLLSVILLYNSCIVIGSVFVIFTILSMLPALYIRYFTPVAIFYKLCDKYQSLKNAGQIAADIIAFGKRKQI